MPSKRASFWRGRPPDIVIWLPKPRCACPVCCVRARETPGSRAARSEAERPFSGRLLTLFEATTPLTAELEEVLPAAPGGTRRSEEFASELQSPDHLVCRLLL